MSRVLSLPLRPDGLPGALNLYPKSSAFAESTVATAQLFAKQAGIALKNAQTLPAARRGSEQLQEALKTRDAIGQAKGILMEREGVSEAQAFEMLKTISQNSNVKLRDIASRLIAEKVLRAPGGGLTKGDTVATRCCGAVGLVLTEPDPWLRIS